jgi:DNA-binding NtrC family response regulator
MDGARVLIIDDEPAMLDNVARLLTGAGFSCHPLGDATAFRSVAEATQPDVVLTDIRMPGADGMTILAASLADDPTRPVILMTAFASVTSAVAAIREGAFDYITKPFSADQLTVAVERAVRYRRLTHENRTLRQQVGTNEVVGGLLGASPGIRRLHQQIRRVAPTEASALIQGESGTGKELVARALHALSARARAPFVTVDCASLPEGLMESELFGHERGAFTGAVQRKEGLLSLANGGTVFLDEIGELPLALQAKLLRVLEQREIRRVGDSRVQALDIRVIAATNVDLRAAVADGRFREDLYYRLEVVTLDVPALRERPGDVRLLAEAFLNEYAEALHRPAPRITEDAWGALEGYRWPGNVRELRNAMQRLVVMDDSGTVTRRDLPDSIRHALATPREDTHVHAGSYDEALAAAMNAFRDGYVRKLLAQFDGNVTQAAVAAGVSRRTLHRWLAELQDAGRTTP